MSQTTTEQTLRQQGLEALKRGQLDTAIGIFGRLLAQQPNNVEIMAALGAAYSQIGQHEQGLKLLDRTVQLKTNSAALHYNRGLALERAGKKLLAGEAYEQTLAINAGHAQARQRLQGLEAALAGGGLPTAAMDDSGLPAAAPDDEDIPAAQFDDDLPAAAPDDDLPAAEPEPEPAAPVNHYPPPLRRPAASPPPAPPKSKPVSAAPTPVVPVASPPPRSAPPLWDGGSASPLKPKAAPTPTVVLPQPKPTILEEQPVGSDEILVSPIEEDEEVLDVLPADGPVAVATAPHRAPAPAAHGRAALTLAEGESFESWVTFEVSEVDSSHLTLKSKNAMAALWVLAAPLSLILAVVLIIWLISGFMDGARISGRGLVGLFFGLIFVLGLCVAAIYKIKQMGSKLAFDAGSRSLEISRWFGMSRQSWSDSELAGVHVALSQVDGDDDVQELKTTLVAPDGGVVAELGEEKVTGEGAAVLLTTSAYVARLLRLPMQIEGRLRGACPTLTDVHAILNRPDWNATTSFDTLDRQQATRSGYVRPNNFGALRTLGLVFYGIFGLVFAVVALYFASAGAFPWEGALVCIVFVGVGIMLFMNGMSGIRDRAIYARHGIFTHQYKGSTAVMIGWGQIAAGAIPVLAIPLVLFFQVDWNKLRGGALSGPVALQQNQPFNPNPQQPFNRPPVGQNNGANQPELPADPIDRALAALHSSSSFQRKDGAEQLARLPVDAARRAEVATVLKANLNPNDGFLMKACLLALQTWGTKDDVTPIVACLNDNNPLARNHVIETLGKMKAADAARPIADKLSDHINRNAASAALRNIGAPAEKFVAAKLTDPEMMVREEAIKILREIGTKDSIAAIREACNDEARSVSLPARALLRKLGEEPPPMTSSGSSRPTRNNPPTTPGSGSSDKPMAGLDKLIEDLNGFDTNRRRAACEDLQKLEPKEKQEEVAVALNKALEDREPLTRRAALRALSTWGIKENVPNMIKLLEDQDAFVRTTAFETLSKLKDERAVDPIAKRLENSIDRPLASKALQELGPVAEKTLLLGLRSRDGETRAEVCRILKVIGTKDSVATLNQFVIANRNGDRVAAGLANEAIKAINDRDKDKK